MTKNDKMWEWVKEYPNFNKLFYNFGLADDKNVSFVPLPTDYKVSEDILGNQTKQYDFAVTLFSLCDTDTPYCLDNLVDFNELQGFVEWGDEQNREWNFPQFGEKCNGEKIECLQNIPTNSGQLDNLAKYMVRCRYTYLEEI